MCRTSSTFRRMYLFQNRENPMIVRKISSGKPVAVNIVLIFESLASHIPLLNKLRRIEKKKFDNLLGNSKVTQTGICCSRTFQKSEEINHFSRKSKDLITEMGNNEIFEFYETSSKRQCSDCAFLGNWYRILHMRKMLAAFGNESTIQQRQI